MICESDTADGKASFDEMSLRRFGRRLTPKHAVTLNSVSYRYEFCSFLILAANARRLMSATSWGSQPHSIDLIGATIPSQAALHAS